jgi:hypothetical protein
MAPSTLNDGSTGDVVIKSGPPASGGGSGGSGGGHGGGGGNRVGASGNFGGPSAKTIALRKQANRERKEKEERDKAQAAAKARQDLEMARNQTRQQLLTGLAQRQGAFKIECDRNFAVRAEQLTQSLADEVLAVRKAPDVGTSSEPWQLYSINKTKSEIDGLRVRKTAQLNERIGVAHSFDGHDPLLRTATDYMARLEQFGEALASGHQIWESAYSAAHEARLLSAQISVLNDKYSALTSEHAEWVVRLAEWERQRQYAEQRDARVRFKRQADADTRIERVKHANTCRFPVKQSMTGMSALAVAGRTWVAGAGDALAIAVSRSVVLLAEVAGTLTVRQLAIFVAGMAYPSELGNGELTPEQRSRLSHAVAVPAHALELHDSVELQTIADAGGSAQAEYRLKPLAIDEGTAIIAARTGGDIDSWVPVVNASLDPLTGAYIAEIPGSPTRYVEFMAGTAPQAQVFSQTPLAVTQPQIQEIPDGVDWRIQDCIVCVPGLEPIYLSFGVPPMGAGVVTGSGQQATQDWWSTAVQPVGAAVPAQIGEQFRGREFNSFGAFDEALWQTLGEHRQLVSSFDELNKKRIERGFAPYAPKSTWVGENREFELRYQERSQFWSDPFDLDQISIKVPNSAEGWIGVVPAVVPWPIPPASTWTPLVPPGSEQVGSTTSPITPTTPLIYPGSPAIPVLPPNEMFPSVDEGQIGASIPGYPGDMELPSPDALFRDRRDDPGVATGIGQVVSGVWLGEAARVGGAPIPSHIADQLRGKEFANFHRFREAFWKAVAADKSLRQQFSGSNLRRMREGMSPYSGVLDQVGGRKAFELHHDVEVAAGGNVYGIDNVSIMTPSRHIQLHKERRSHDF